MSKVGVRYAKKAREAREQRERKALEDALRFATFDPEKPRRTPVPSSPPITPETYERLLQALETVYPGKWRRAVDVQPVAVNKTIDNEIDALETIRRIEERKKKA